MDQRTGVCLEENKRSFEEQLLQRRQTFGSSVLTIRQAEKDDIPRLIAFGKRAFTLQFGHMYAPQDLENYLIDEYTEEHFCEWLDDDKKSLLVAVTEDVAIKGYTLCGGPCGLPHEDVTPLDGEVKKCYIDPAFFGTGLAQAIFTEALHILKTKLFPNGDLYLGVFSENERAQKFYAKFGFEKVGEYLFPVGATMDREFILRAKNQKAV